MTDSKHHNSPSEKASTEASAPQPDALMIIENADLQTKHTFGLPAQAKYFATIKSLDGLLAGLDYAKDNAKDLLILGGGSNTVFMADWPSLVLHIDIAGIQKIHEDTTDYYIFAGAGVHWHSFVAYCLAEEWFGLENLALIPGLVGAAPIQNIGAYGVEVGEYIEHVHAVDRETKALVKLSREDCAFGYRDSIFKQAAKDKYVIIGVTFKFPKQWQPRTDYGGILESIGEEQEITPVSIFEAVVSIRQAKLPDPELLSNAGSFFKNSLVNSDKAAELLEKYPDMPHFWMDDGKTICKIPSGWLIDQVGLKGYRHEGVGVYDNQALVLVNHGDGDAEQLQALIEHIQEEVGLAFDIELEIEPNIIGA